MYRMNRSSLLLLLLLVLLFGHDVASLGSFRGLVNLLDGDLPEFQQVPDFNRDAIIRRTASFDPCKEGRQLCSDGSTCVADNGNFHCLCPPTHYGKSCQYIFDESSCVHNKCVNNSTCVSLATPRKVIDIRLDEPNSNAQIELNYDCICRAPFSGAFCQVNDGDQHCTKNHCLERGRGRLNSNGRCECECDPQYFGKRCEHVSVCYENPCKNGGICVTRHNATNIWAKCRCPRFVLGGAVKKVFGERCEKVWIDETKQSLMPCQSSAKNWIQFVDNLKKEAIKEKQFEVAETISKIRQNYHPRNPSQQPLATANSSWCENNAKCHAVIEQIHPKIYYHTFKCECVEPRTEGIVCEYRRDDDACALTQEESRSGVVHRCTSAARGVCINVSGDARCLCRPGYAGLRCQIVNPCAASPCRNGVCLPTDRNAQGFECLCASSYQLVNGTECRPLPQHESCRRASCGHGRCVPCEPQADDDLLPLCTKFDESRGYRCLCDIGYNPPSCRMHTNPCHQNMCKNSGKCVPNALKSYDCQCINGTSGSFCENVDDVCTINGHSTCAPNGFCVHDVYTQRGFRCQCKFGFEGLNCDIIVSTPMQIYRIASKESTFILPLIALSLMLTVVLATIRRRNK